MTVHILSEQWVASVAKKLEWHRKSWMPYPNEKKELDETDLDNIKEFIEHMNGKP